MKIAILAMMLFLASCVSNPNRRANLEYNKVISFTIGTSNEQEVMKAFGIPSSRISENGLDTLVYHDPETGAERLTVGIQSTSKKVSSLLWIPGPDDKQLAISEAKAGFGKTNFKEILEVSDNPHSVTEAVFFVDEQLGITIRYDKTNDVVEAIGLYDVLSRGPAASQKKATKVRYTVGE